MLRICAFATFLVAACGYYFAEEQRFFPTGAFGEDEDDDGRKVERYTGYLKAMGEPSLWDLAKTDPNITAYRLLWLPSFHSPIAVRAVKSDKSVLVHIVKLDGTGGAKPGQVAAKRERKMTDDEWTVLQVLLEKSTYWRLKKWVKTDLASGIVMDGDRLICEGVDGGRYHVVDRSDPEPEYEKMCKFLLGLSGIDIRKAWAEYHDEAE